MNLLPLNSIIAEHNINKFYETGKIDEEYLQNYSADNIPQLVELYDKIQPKDYKNIDLEDLNWYLYYFDPFDYVPITSFQEYNISKQKAKKALREFKKTHKEISIIDCCSYDEEEVLEDEF